MYISFPTGENLKTVIQGFRSKWNIPQCAGSVDGTHIPITPPAMNHTDYYYRKGWYSIIAQAVVDHNGLFRDLCIGWPGSVHDARVFANSALYNKVTNGDLLQGQEFTVRGGTIPIFLIGDSAYPLLEWLIKPFPFSSSLSRQHKNCNYRISRGRVVVEMAFGRLKVCWRRLYKKIDMHINNVPNVVLACCILHNICEIHGDEFNEEWLEDLDLVQLDDTDVSTTTHDGGTVRDLLANYFEHH